MTKHASIREQVVTELNNIIASESIKEGDRLRAIDLISQIHNLYDSADDLDNSRPIYIVTGARPAQWQNLKIFVEKKKLHQLEKWNKIRDKTSNMTAAKYDSAGNILEDEGEERKMTEEEIAEREKEDNDGRRTKGVKYADNGNEPQLSDDGSANESAGDGTQTDEPV
jgi:hypothetical protein